jgi:hypothetical protein
MSDNILCPVCDQSDLVEKVSTLYITGIGLSRSTGQAYPLPEGSAPSTPGSEMIGLSTSDLRQLSRRLKPPSSGKGTPFRALHPDLVVLTFSLIIPVFLYGIFTSQTNLFLPALVLLVVFYGVYFLRRKSMIAKFDRQVEASRAATRRSEQRIGRWMKLYYCARDDVVFVPKTSLSVPADQMAGIYTQPDID